MILEFKTQLKECYVIGISNFIGLLEDKDYDTELEKSELHFALKFKLQKNGINKALFSFESLTVSLRWIVDCYGLDDKTINALVKKCLLHSTNEFSERVVGEIEINISKNDTNWTIENSAEFTPQGGFRLDSVTIDLINKKIELE